MHRGSTPPPAEFHPDTGEGGVARWRLSGRLEASSVAGPWAEARAALARVPTRPVAVDCAGVTYCDVAGIALLVDLLRQPRPPGAGVEIQHLPDAYRQLLAEFEPAAFREPAPPTRERPRLPERVGRAAAALGEGIRELVAFLGEASAALAAALRHPGAVRWRDTLAVAEEVGVNALPLVALIAFLMGLILAFQAGVAMKRFGAELFVADLVGIALLRELAPLMTAILLAGRSGAAFAAELGTMKVNEELNALTTMGLEPVRFLVVPRLLAAIVMTPLLTVLADLVGLVGGAVVMRTFDIPFVMYYQEVVRAVDLGDLYSGLLKSLVFGILVAGVGCLRGLQTRMGAAAVGLSTTQAVVSGIVLIVVTDGLFAVLFYYAGF